MLNKFSYCPTSYSCENRRASLALSRSMWSASSQTDMGGCSLIPKRENKTTRSGDSSHLMHCTVTAGSESVSFELRRARHKEVILAPWCDMILRWDLCWHMLCPFTSIPKSSSGFLVWGVILVSKNIPLPLSAPVNLSRLHAQLELRKCSACVLFDEERRGVRNREDLSLWFQWLRMNEQDWDA